MVDLLLTESSNELLLLLSFAFYAFITSSLVDANNLFLLFAILFNYDLFDLSYLVLTSSKNLSVCSFLIFLSCSLILDGISHSIFSRSIYYNCKIVSILLDLKLLCYPTIMSLISGVEGLVHTDLNLDEKLDWFFYSSLRLAE